MEVTVRLDDDLLTSARAHAARTGRTLTELLDEAIRTLLVLEDHPSAKSPQRLPTYGSGGLRPGVDLDRSADLFDRMEGRDAVR